MALSLLSMALFLCVCVLRKGKRKPASQDRNGYLRRGLWVQALHHYRENSAKDPSGCMATTLRPQLKMDWTGHDKRMRRAPSCPPRYWPSLQHSSVSPLCQRGNSPPCTATKPRQLFKTGCLSEASFPSNKQSAKPDFGRQRGSTRVTLFPHPVSWSIGAPEGVWAARRWEGSGLRWKPEALCQATGGRWVGLHHSRVCGTEQGGIVPWGGEGNIACMLMHLSLYQTITLSESILCCPN